MEISELSFFKNIKKILVIKLRHLGDVVLTIPVFKILKRHFADSQVYALVNSGTEEVLEGNPYIDGIIVFNREIKQMNPFKRFIEEFLFYKSIKDKKFDMSINLTSGDRGALISLISGAKYRIAYKPKKGLIGKQFFYTHLGEKKKNHSLLQNIELLRQFGIGNDINSDTFDTSIFIPEEADFFVKELFRKYNITDKDIVIHIHPTSRWLFKCWKDDYMAEIIKWLIEKGVYIIITSSPQKKEIEKVNSILSLIPKSYYYKIINLSGETNIKQLAAISKASDLFFGIDTAPMHIAAFVGTPVVALFGDGEYEWKPWGDIHLVISKKIGNKEQMSREEYIRKNLFHITPGEVKEKIEIMLKRINKW